MTEVLEERKERPRHQAERMSDAFVQLICVERPFRSSGEVIEEEVEEGTISLLVVDPNSIFLGSSDLNLQGLGQPTKSTKAMALLYTKLRAFQATRLPFRFVADGPTGQLYGGRISFEA